ncbi:MAG: acyloxyacyl hydrolase [Paludibacteraceae bacterium]|nr:acyloxyacyl hydrolase [Paludibacteraceae bacterium]
MQNYRYKIILFCLCFSIAEAFAMPHYELAYRLSGTSTMMMKDGKVDPWLGGRPVLGGSFSVEFLPTGRWHCLQQWNNASIGVGAGYLNLGNDSKLGSAFTAFGYMNQPFYNGKHFGIGLRPTVGLAAVTKRYSNTYEGAHPYHDHEGANWSIGSILNAYLALELYMDFPIKNGWTITLNGGWRHISNGSFMHPNAGYNMFGGELGVRYQANVRRKDVRSTKELADTTRTYQAPKPDVPRKLYDGVDKPWAVEISATGGAKQNYYADNRNGQLFFGIATVKAAAYWVPLSIFRVGAGVDAFYDGYYACVSNSIPEAKAAFPDAPVTYFGKTYLKESNVKNCFRVGISVQPEFIIGNLTAGIHVGFYVFDPVKNLEPFTGKKTWDTGQGAKEMDEAGTPLNRGIFYRYDFADASNYQDGWCYMQFVLKYHVLDHLFVQLGLKTHGVRAEFIDAGIGVAF